MNPKARSFFVAVLPAPIADFYRRLRTAVQVRRKWARPPEEVFSEIYKNNVWGGANGEMHSGPGSRFAQAELYVETVGNFIRDNGISRVIDLGCGDFEIGKKLANACDFYIGIDVVPELIDRNRQLFENDRVRFICADITEVELPDADVCLVRQVFQHMSNKHISKVIKRLRKYKYLIVTEHQPDNPISYNKDKVDDAGIRFDLGSGVYLEQPPFNVRDVRLLFEMHPMVAGELGEPVERRDWGLLRTYLVKI